MKDRTKFFSSTSCLDMKPLQAMADGPKLLAQVSDDKNPRIQDLNDISFEQGQNDTDECLLNSKNNENLL